MAESILSFHIYPIAAATIACTFSSLALAGISQPDWRMNPFGPSALISFEQYA